MTVDNLLTHPSAGLRREEALHLLREAPLLELAQRADALKRKLHGDRVTFVSNLHINPTNLCVYSCRFCDFAAKPGDGHAYVLTEDEILEQIGDPGLSEVHIVGGLSPKWDFDRSLALVALLRKERPGLWIKAFTAVEVAYFARMARLSYAEVLEAMKEAGVDMLPGGGAEVLSARLHALLYSGKIGPDSWLEIHALAHGMGLRSNATLLFGHIETDEEIVEHLFLLRDLQARTGGFVSFIPLAYQPGKTGLVGRLAGVPRCLRIIAVSRLVLDNVPHIKAYWPSLQLETAAAALHFGADDLDGTLGKERIMQLAETQAPSAASRLLLTKIVEDAGLTPVERDGAFNPIQSLNPDEVTPEVCCS